MGNGVRVIQLTIVSMTILAYYHGQTPGLQLISSSIDQVNSQEQVNTLYIVALYVRLNKWEQLWADNLPVWNYVFHALPQHLFLKMSLFYRMYFYICPYMNEK